MRPVLQRAPAGLRGPERYWALIRARAATFTLRDIYDDTPGVTRNAVRRYLRGLVKLGLVEVTGHRPGGRPNAWDAVVYRCRRRPAATPVVHDVEYSIYGQRLQQLWNAMRTLPQFTVDELVVAASTDEVPVKRGRAAELVNGLKRHGLVRLVQPKRGRHNGSTPAVFALCKAANTGPKPPRINRVRGDVFDANLQEWLITSDEVPA